MASDSGIRFIEDISSEPPAVQKAINEMIAEMKAEHEQEERDLAETKAAAVRAVESAIAAHQQPSPRLAG